METYLLGYGFAVVLALISWSDNIKDIQKETREIETEFAKKKGTSYTKIRIILSQQRGISLEKRIDSLISFFRKTGPDREIDEILTVIKEFRQLFELRVKLENYIQLKFRMIVILAFYFIISGVAACCISNTCYVYVFKIKVLVEYLFIILLIPYFIFLLFYLIFLNKKELFYREKLSETLELF